MISETELRGLLVKECDKTSAADVARQIGVSRTIISDMCRGKRRISNKVAKYLGYAWVRQKVRFDRFYTRVEFDA